MNTQIPDKKISDYMGLPISISHCMLRMHRDSLTTFRTVGTPHMLRFRRVYKNIMKLNGLYSIYIDSDLKLLLYENDRPGTINVADSTDTPVSIPVYQFSGMEAVRLYRTGEYTAKEIYELTGVRKATLYKNVRKT